MRVTVFPSIDMYQEFGLSNAEKIIEKFSENIKNNANSLPQDQHLDNLSLKNKVICSTFMSPIR